MEPQSTPEASTAEVAADRSPETVQAFAYLGGILLRAGAGLLGIASIATLFGWRIAEGYFLAFGAPWVVPELTSIQLLWFSRSLVVPLTLSCWLSFFMYAMEDWSPKTITRIGIILNWLAVAALVFPLLIGARLPHQVVAILSTAGSAAWAAALGFIIGHLAVSLRDNHLRWSKGMLFLSFAIIVVGTFQVPEYVASAQFEVARDPVISPLPVVEDDAASGDWRLLALIDGQRILVNIKGSPSTIEIQLRPNSEILRLRGRGIP
jgi:hypothetical protein